METGMSMWSYCRRVGSRVSKRISASRDFRQVWAMLTFPGEIYNHSVPEIVPVGNRSCLAKSQAQDV